MRIKLDGQSVTSSMDVKSKVKALSSLRKIPTVNEKKIHRLSEVVQLTDHFCPAGNDS